MIPFAATIALLLASVEAPPAQVFPTPSPIPDTPDLPGDAALSCPAILAEAQARQTELDRIEEEREAIVYKKGAGTQALEVAGAVAGGVLPSLAGQAASMAALQAQMATTKEDAKANYGEIDRRFDWVLNRMSLMHSLYQQRCLSTVAE